MKKTLTNGFFSWLMVASGIFVILGANYINTLHSAMKLFSLDPAEPSSPLFLIFAIIYGMFCITAGVLGLRLKPAAPGLMISAGYLLFILVLVVFFCFGFMVNPIQLLVLAGIAAMIVAGYSRKTLFELYDLKEKQSKKIRLIHISTTIVIGLITLSYGYFRFVELPRSNCEVTFSKEKWTIQPVASTEKYVNYQFLSLNAMIPEGMILRRSRPNQSAFFIDKNKTMIIVLSRDNLFVSLAPVGKVLGEKDSYAFGQKVLQEKISMIFLTLKSLIGPSDFQPIDSPKWKGFIEDRRGTYNAFLWSKNKKQSLEITVGSKNQAKRKLVLENMIRLLDVR